MRVFLYSLQTAYNNLWREKWINALTILTISVVLLILGTFALISLNIDSAIKQWSKGFGIIVYVDEDLSRERENLLKEYFQKDPDVVDVKYVSKESALRDLRQIMGTMTSILDGFEENPLPTSFELKIKAEALDPLRIRQKASEIKELTGVEDVQYGEKWLSSLNALLNGMKIMVVLFGSIIFVAIIFATYSTIKILFYRRKDEIETLKLLGATRGFIRLPFLIEGLFFGLSGGVIGFFGLFAIYHFTAPKIIEFIPSINVVIVFFPLKIYLATPLAGAVMSLIGSLFAIGKIRY